MPRNNRSTKRNNHPKKPNNGQLTVLKDILDLQRTEAATFVERVKDVPRMYLKRDKVYSFTRSTNTSFQMVNSTTVPITYVFAPSLTNFPNSSEFSNLFEQWRIVQATWFFMPLFNSTTVINPLYTWFDPDDGNSPTGISEGQQSETLRITKGGNYVERTYTPQVSQGAVSTGTVPGYSAPSSKLWMDTDSPGNLYYGLKAVIPANTNISNAVPLYTIEVSAIIQLRRPK